MLRISPKTAKASGTKGKSVSICAHSVLLPYVQAVSENGLSIFFEKTRSWHTPQALF